MKSLVLLKKSEGLVAKSRQQLKFPQATAWTQPHIGDLPNADLYQQQPLLIKLAQNHVGIDFLLIKPKLGVRNIKALLHTSVCTAVLECICRT